MVQIFESSILQNYLKQKKDIFMDYNFNTIISHLVESASKVLHKIDESVYNFDKKIDALKS